MRLTFKKSAIFVSTLLFLSPIAQAIVIDNKLSTVTPVIKENCLACHNSPANTKLDYSNTLGWLNSTLITSGDASKSRLLTVFTSQTPNAMKGLKLTDKDRQLIQDWIAQVKVTCSPTNSKIDTTKGDGCGCTNGFDDIRNASGELQECRKPVVITCSVGFSQVNTSMPDGCGCIPGYTEKRDTNKKLVSCSAPTYTFDVELKRYNRCHGQFTRSSILAGDTRVAQIKAKKMTGVQACMDLLKKGNLNTSGRIKSNPSGDYDLEGMQVLSTFQKFHMSWFTNHNWADVAANLNAFYRGTQDLYYSGDSALYMTNALFGTDVPYSSIVTSNISYEAIRSNPSNNTYVRSNFSKYEYMGQTKERLEWSPENKMEVGNLIGIKEAEASTVPYLSDLKVSNVEYKLPDGGGILGLNTFFMLNSGRSLLAKANGGTATYRKWSKYIYKDVLCREIPVIRSSDVAFLRQKLPASDLTFRNGNSCLQCHFSIDGMAGVIRNKTITRTGIDMQNTTLTQVHSLMTYKYPVTEAAETFLEKSDNDLNFYKRNPLGNLVFRSYDGTFYNKQYEGPEEMGKAISELDDLYICAASRYYRFLTGVDVEIRDYNDPMSPVENSSDEIKYRNMIISLGKNLKKHQSLNKLIEEIVASPLYITPGKVE